MDNDYRLVDFETYCKRCKYKDVKENKDPCCECLDYGANEHTDTPVYFEEGETK